MPLWKGVSGRRLWWFCHGGLLQKTAAPPNPVGHPAGTHCHPGCASSPRTPSDPQTHPDLPPTGTPWQLLCHFQRDEGCGCLLLPCQLLLLWWHPAQQDKHHPLSPLAPPSLSFPTASFHGKYWAIRWWGGGARCGRQLPLSSVTLGPLQAGQGGWDIRGWSPMTTLCWSPPPSQHGRASQGRVGKQVDSEPPILKVPCMMSNMCHPPTPVSAPRWCLGSSAGRRWDIRDTQATPGSLSETRSAQRVPRGHPWRCHQLQCVPSAPWVTPASPSPAQGPQAGATGNLHPVATSSQARCSSPAPLPPQWGSVRGQVGDSTSAGCPQQWEDPGAEQQRRRGHVWDGVGTKVRVIPARIPPSPAASAGAFHWV